MIDETVATFELLAQAKGLRLTSQVEPDLPSVSCDRDRILQVLSNLVSNAIKITPAGGQIALTVDPQGADLVFGVTDNGPGISEKDARHLFERYWRGDAKYIGSGLGLAIAKGIVHAHLGRIWVDTQLGRGTTFSFTVPVGVRPQRP